MPLSSERCRDTSESSVPPPGPEFEDGLSHSVRNWFRSQIQKAVSFMWDSTLSIAEFTFKHVFLHLTYCYQIKVVLQ